MRFKIDENLPVKAAQLLQGIVVPLLTRESVDRCLWIVDERGVRIREDGSVSGP